jgi:DNA polymerase III subunit alpha
MKKGSVDFVHLHVHSAYDLQDGAIKIDALVDRAVQFGMDAVAITDHAVMYGVPMLYEKAAKANIKPIIGCEYNVVAGHITDSIRPDEKSYHLVVLAENMDGYRNLCKLVSIAHLHGFRGVPCIDMEILQEHSKGLIGLSGCLNSEIAGHILKDRLTAPEKAAVRYVDIFGENDFFLEVQDNGIRAQKMVNQALADMSHRLSIPLVATNNCHYLDRKDAGAHRVLLCVRSGKKFSAQDPGKFKTDQFHFKSTEEMHPILTEYPDALENSIRIARRCNVELSSAKCRLPKTGNDSKPTPDEQLKMEANQRLDKILERERHNSPDINVIQYLDRLEQELSAVTSKDLSRYFLIIADYVRYAKRNGIQVGPGRGSSSGSLLAYCLGITAVDPIKHHLLFECLIPEDLLGWPEIEIDVGIDDRDKVTEYVNEKYGYMNVSQIITFAYLTRLEAVREVGRCLDIPVEKVDRILRLIPCGPGSLDQAIRENPALRQLEKVDRDLRALFKVSRTIEGAPTHVSTHACALTMSESPLSDHLPLTFTKEGDIMTQYNINTLERFGLSRFNVLGLRDVSMIKNICEKIRGQNKIPAELEDLNLNDPMTFDLIASGRTTGVSQFQSDGIKTMMRLLEPECFDHITAAQALYRPGPLNFQIDKEYIKRRHGEAPITYMTPELAPILRETYGLILYQEQLMEIASNLAGYSLTDANGFRKALGTKRAELLEDHRRRFIQGATANGIDDEAALNIFEMSEYAGGWVPLKAHCVAYAMISYQMAYLKAHFPNEFNEIVNRHENFTN